MSFDSLFAWRESIEGIQTAVWPPMQAYLSWLSRVLTGSPGGFFFGQVFVLLFNSALILSLFLRRLISLVVAFLIFCAMFAYFPSMMGVLGTLWKDVATTSFAVLGVALWLVAVRRVSYGWLAAAVVALSLSVAMRYNALPLILPLMVLMVVSPFGGIERPRARSMTAAMLAIGVVAAFASTVWRLPDLHQLPSSRGFAGVEEFDLIGITACSNQDYIPLGMSSGQPITPTQVRILYDPRHVQMAFRLVPGIPRMTEGDAGGAVAQAWRKAVPANLGCYLAHRTNVFVEQMGLAQGELFYPTHGGIDDNPWGIKLAHPALSQRFNAYVAEVAPEVMHRPAWLYLLATIAVGDLVAIRANGRVVLASLLLGALVYPATLFFVGPAADARYIFPPNVFCALILVLSPLLAARAALQANGVNRRDLATAMRDRFSGAATTLGGSTRADERKGA
ncbi:MAG TPA: hypothetical protein VGL58_04950 [Caulobacteraceae bacterium]|jgi:hypothetical protein